MARNATSFKKGNKANPLGLNQYGARKGGVIQASIETKAMGKEARQLINEGRIFSSTYLKVHHQLAEELQKQMADALEDSVRETGRAQRPKSQTNRLATVIKSPRNRRVNLDGYTVGYLDDFAAVRPYWRGLEVGSSRHVGRFLPGSFQNTSGRLVRPIEGGKDPRYLQFRGRGIQPLGTGGARGANRAVPQMGVRIKNPIKGYHYHDRGLRNFISDGGTRELAHTLYAAALKGVGEGGLAAAMARGGNSLGRQRKIGFTTEPAGPTPGPE